ncbi:MAG: hypothetical protein HC828_07735 [Blastochloris sp.]|nr:hypothetical protein [Blastochloris sp.]
MPRPLIIFSGATMEQQDLLGIVDTLTNLGTAAVLLFLYIRQDERLRTLENKYMALLDKLIDDQLKAELAK